MRLVLGALALTLMVSTSHGQECVPADFDASRLVGRWDEVYCHDPLEDEDCRTDSALYFRADGFFIQTSYGRIVWRGTWCVTSDPRDPRAPSFLDEPLIEIESDGYFSSMHFHLCEGSDACEIEGMSLERGLITIGASELADLKWSTTWEYAGAPVSNDATSWSSLKEMYR